MPTLNAAAEAVDFRLALAHQDLALITQVDSEEQDSITLDQHSESDPEFQST